MRARKKDSTTHPVPFFVTSTADHITGKTGLTPTITISKDGTTALSAAAGAITEIGSGWYAIAGSSADRSTLGTLVHHVSSSASDPADFSVDIVSVDIFDLNLGLGATVTVTPTSPVVSAGVLTIVPGDDYFAVDSRSIDLTYSGTPSLTAATAVTLAIRLQGASTNTVAITGSVLSATQLRFEPTSAQTVLLAPDSVYDYQVQVLLAGTSHVTTLETGTVTTLLNLPTP